MPDISKVVDCLHKVYKQAVDTIEIETDTLTVNGLDKFSHGGSGVLTVYNDDQKRVLRAYNDSIKDGVYYLFFIDNATDKPLTSEFTNLTQKSSGKKEATFLLCIDS